MTQQLTPTYQLPYYQGSDPADGATQQRALAERMEAVLTQLIGRNGTAMVGEIKLWPTANAPGGWLLCVGTQAGITAALYPKLDQVLGHDGSGLVLIPDMRDRFPVGPGAASVLGSGGSASVTLTSAQSGMVAHDHGTQTGLRTSGEAHQHSGGTGDVVQASGGELLIGYAASAPASQNYYGLKSAPAAILTSVNDTPDHRHTIGQQAAADAGAGHENRPTFRALAFIIRAG
jgi:microcystin-dependent protein